MHVLVELPIFLVGLYAQETFPVNCARRLTGLEEGHFEKGDKEKPGK